jgi:hypothetical protein
VSTDEELGQGEDNVTIEDVTNNPAAQADLNNTDQQNIIEPEEHVSVSCWQIRGWGSGRFGTVTTCQDWS